MITITRKAQLYHFENTWLSAYWHFSFDHYFDPGNVAFGPLRVFNDDTIRPGSGFPPHGHKEMEIVTLVLSGLLEHEDDQGNRGLIRPGEVQVMSAGWGISHAERNPSPDEPLHLFQLWFLPRTKRHPPRWEQRAFPSPDRGHLLPVVSDGALPGTLAIDQEIAIFLGSLGAGDALTHSLGSGRRAYLVGIGGEWTLNGQTMMPGDAARVTDESALSLKGLGPAELVLLDLP